jgi:hypothetical protein
LVNNNNNSNNNQIGETLPYTISAESVGLWDKWKIPFKALCKL